VPAVEDDGEVASLEDDTGFKMFRAKPPFKESSLSRPQSKECDAKE
jgi:hypothetical protein